MLYAILTIVIFFDVFFSNTVSVQLSASFASALAAGSISSSAHLPIIYFPFYFAKKRLKSAAHASG